MPDGNPSAKQEIVCRATGQVLDDQDVDVLLDHWEFLRARKAEIELTLAAITAAVASRAQGHGKTLRVRGERRRVKVELPGDHFNQGKLKGIYESFLWAKEYLRIDRLAVNLVEYKKLLNETGNGPFMRFREELVSANEGPKGSPRLVLEE